MQALTINRVRRPSAAASIRLTAEKAVAAIFSRKVATVISIIALSCMYFHLITVDDAVAQGERVAVDIAAGLPWIASLIFAKKGGRNV